MKCGRSEHVLLHAAAGGVGLAALQVLRTSGCIPIATAGSPSKRAAVRRLGCAHALNSRDASFAEGVATLGGAHALLNSMTTPGLIAASLSGEDHPSQCCKRCIYMYMTGEMLSCTPIAGQDKQPVCW